MAQSGYPLCYLGSLPVGKVGDTSFLDWAIRKVMKDPAKIDHSVSLHLLELGIKLYCRTTAELVLKYPYPKVITKAKRLKFFFRHLGYFLFYYTNRPLEFD